MYSNPHEGKRHAQKKGAGGFERKERKKGLTRKGWGSELKFITWGTEEKGSFYYYCYSKVVCFNVLLVVYIMAMHIHLSSRTSSSTSFLYKMMKFYYFCKKNINRQYLFSKLLGKPFARDYNNSFYKHVSIQTLLFLLI